MPTPTSTRYEQDAAKWHDAGRPVPEKLDHWYVVILNCWCASSGAKNEPISPQLEDYRHMLMNEIDRRYPKWLDEMFDGREHCRTCGESWRSENMSLCTHCPATFAPCHMPGEYTSNGNPLCSSCGIGEIVG